MRSEKTKADIITQEFQCSIGKGKSSMERCSFHYASKIPTGTKKINNSHSKFTKHTIEQDALSKILQKQESSESDP
jgi:hypothetical protein